MKKSILNLGKTLNKTEQKNIYGKSMALNCGGGLECPRGYSCGNASSNFCVKI